MIIAAAALVAAGLAGISHGIALLVRREETLIAILNFFGLPLTFLSAILITEALMPDWMQWAARFNPVNWGVVAAREMSSVQTDWGRPGSTSACSLAFATATCLLASRAFESTAGRFRSSARPKTAARPPAIGRGGARSAPPST